MKFEDLNKRNEMMIEVMELFDKLDALENENQTLRKKLGLGEEDDLPEEDVAQTVVRKCYFRYKIYPLIAKEILFESGDHIGEPMPYKTWVGELGFRDIIGYDKELLEELSLEQVKKYFNKELKEVYDKKLEIYWDVMKIKKEEEDK